MTRRAAGGVAIGLALAGCATAKGAMPPPLPAAEWRLSWSDEFDGPAGAAVDSARWTFDVGGGGWGNAELESYTDRPTNAHLRGDGLLVIDVLRESHVGSDGQARDYTSARLKTQGIFAQTYGRFEARLKVPRGQGIWPAFWMLGADVTSVGWPACGEIDILENRGREPGIAHGTLHGPGYSGGSGITAAFELPKGQAFADDFHRFALEWEPSALRWYVDGQLYETLTFRSLPAGSRWVFDHPFFLLLNVAVGGSWSGYPDATTVFPQQMLVDYVRVYQR